MREEIFRKKLENSTVKRILRRGKRSFPFENSCWRPLPLVPAFFWTKLLNELFQRIKVNIFIISDLKLGKPVLKTIFWKKFFNLEECLKSSPGSAWKHSPQKFNQNICGKYTVLEKMLPNIHLKLDWDRCWRYRMRKQIKLY